MITDLVVKNGKLYGVKYYNHGKSFSLVLMSGPIAVHILTAVKGYKEGYTGKPAKVRDIANACGISVWITVPAIVIAALLADIINYNAATGATRKALWVTINTTVKSLMRTTQNAADLLPASAEIIITASGFKVKKVFIRQKNVFTLTQGETSGTLICKGDTISTARFHAWWISRNGIDFTLIMGTGDAENILEGLAPGRVWIQHQYRMRKGPHGPVKVLFIDLI